MKTPAFLLFMLLTTPAFAHQGDHTRYDFAALIAHVFETDHIVFAAIAVLTGVLAYRAGRASAKSSEVDAGSREDFAAEKKAEARAIAKRDDRHDSR